MMKFLLEDERLAWVQNGTLNAEMQFTRILDGKVWSVHYTYVTPEFRGRGIAGQLLDELVAQARQMDVKIKADCKFVKEKFFIDPKYADIIYQE
ncbi:N-acetyltransferase [Weissella muntiaci]|uniref:N-acetyltransferase n=1 Tax=Weissella muntiaci TaxID=2508881 RepID=A0A6C2C9L2_9LACO|nr:GNAT family N-acetyltransferase [Weissella muntiaci]TYC50614.1 N-acetyltransferase [Weissella muntiaci]